MRIINIYKRKLFSFLIVLLLAVIPMSFGLVFVDKNYAQASSEVILEKMPSYYGMVDTLAENVSFSSPYTSFYEPGEPTTVYNFVVVARFSGEPDVMNDTVSGLGLSYIQALNEMFNSQTNYSVNKYYKTVSNGLLNLETVFVTQSTSFAVSKPRSDYGNADINGGVGYDPDGMIMGVLPESYVLEYKMLAEIYSHAISSTINTPTYRATSDSNGDGKIDSLTIIYLPQPVGVNVNVGWSDLLWPHASEVQVDIVASYGWMFGVNVNSFRYSYNGGYVNAGNYMMTHFETDISPKTGLPDVNTITHELGHVLGWPDYYIYNIPEFGDTASDSANEPVFAWDIMAYSHLDSQQYPTTYSRNIQGWMPSSSITEITANGQYSLLPVNYEEVSGQAYSGRTIAYKITNPDNPYQSFWFEYRKQDSTSFEDNGDWGVPNGLLVYRVDEGFAPVSVLGTSMSMLKNPGNFAAAPYNLYVFRNDISGYVAYQENFMAPLTTANKSMGDGATYSIGGRTYTASNLTWQVYTGDVTTPQNDIANSSVSYVNSGVSVVVNQINPVTGLLTFTINWDNFGPAEEEGVEIQRASFGDNTLYNALLSLAGKTTQETLNSRDLYEETSLALSGLNITSLVGLELMEFQALSRLNLNYNQLNNITQVNNVISANPNVIISLIGNRFNLISLSSPNLQNTSLIWGFQLNNYLKDDYIFNSPTTPQREFFWTTAYNNYFSAYVNGNQITNSSSLQYYSFSTYQRYEFDFVANSQGGFEVRPSEGIISYTVISITLPNPNVQRNSDFPSLIIQGITEQELNIIRTPQTQIDTSVITANPFQVIWNISVVANPAKSTVISGDFNIIDNIKPVVTLTDDSIIEIIRGNDIVLPAKEIIINDNGDIDLPYVFNEHPQETDREYWSKRYYTVTYTEFGTDLNFIDSFSTENYGDYAIGYYAVDSAGNNSFMKYRYVFITAEEVALSEFDDPELYDLIIEVQGKGLSKVYRDSLYYLTYADLSGRGITSAKGLEHLEFQSDIVLNLSNNSIFNLNGISELIENENLAKVYLMFNNLPSSTPLSDKYILGIQGLTNELYLQGMQLQGLPLTQIDFYNFDDYSIDFSFDSGIYDIQIGSNSILIHGEYIFGFIGALATIQKQFRFARVDFNQTDITLDVFENFDLTQNILFEAITSDELDLIYKLAGIVFDPQTYNLTDIIGQKDISLEISFNGELVNILNLVLEVLDRISPTIQLLGQQNIFLFVGDTFAEPSYTASDNYNLEQEIDIEVNGSVDTGTVGTYQITYQAIDSSNNTSEIQTRNVYVGSITPKQNVEVDVMLVSKPSEISMFEIQTYNLSDFETEILSVYNRAVIGQYDVQVRFTFTQDPSRVFLFENQIQVVDINRPEIVLQGATVIYSYVGSIYQESGVYAIDNYDGNIQAENIQTAGFFDTNTVGVYTINYSVSDSSGNESLQKSRILNIIPKPFDNLKVVILTESEAIRVGNKVEFVVDLTEYNSHEYNFDATFVWFIDGVQINNESGSTLEYIFTDIGMKSVEARVYNANLEGGLEINQSSEQNQFMVLEGNFLESYGLLVIGGGAAGVFSLIIFSFISRKRRKFYF